MRSLRKIQSSSGVCLSIPASKSFTNRAIILASLSAGKSHLFNASLCDDSKSLLSAVENLGVCCAQQDASLQIDPPENRFNDLSGRVNLGLGATTARFVLPLFAMSPSGSCLLYGKGKMHERPMGELYDALRQMGAHLQESGRADCLPVKVEGVGSLSGGKIRLGGRTSSQFISSLLMAAPTFLYDLELEIEGELASRSYVDMTISTMKHFGVEVRRLTRGFKVTADSSYHACDYHIEGDASGASYIWSIAALNQHAISTTGIPLDSLQGDLKYLELLEQMGCRVNRKKATSDSNEDRIEISGPQHLKAIQADLSNMPDSAQSLAVLAAFAEGTSRITGLASLKIKETDRLLALHNELKKMGIQTSVGSDHIEILGGEPRAARIKTYDDHRMAMAFSIAAARLDDLEIVDSEVVSKSQPGYWGLLQELGIESSV